jgi:hypothetical protein
MDGRQKYGRPQALLFANNPGVLDNGKIVPEGEEFVDFIVLSDDNRDPISFSIDRIETRKRMINGRQRSYHVADKIKISTGWKGLPSRAFGADPAFTNLGASDITESTGQRVLDQNSTITGMRTVPSEAHTTDGGAGGAELLNWYNNNSGSFWVYLAYDNHKNFSTDEFNKLNQYNEVVEVFFSNFSYSVEKRGTSTHDYWNVDIDLEEV